MEHENQENRDSVQNEVARLTVKHGPVFTRLLHQFGGADNLEEATRCMEEGYLGAFAKLSAYAAELYEDCYGNVHTAAPDAIRRQMYFDRVARSTELGGDILTIECEGKVHVFDARI
ncbi:MAG: hypothetical protein ABSH20_13625 [Tepidisphaeraceae bacterium]|jgi:hypothetical protein